MPKPKGKPGSSGDGIPDAPTELVLVPRDKVPQAEAPDSEAPDAGAPEGAPLRRLREFPAWDDGFCESLPELGADPFEAPLPALCPELARVTKGWRRIADVFADLQRRQIDTLKKKRAEEPEDDDDPPIDETIREPVLVAPRREPPAEGDDQQGSSDAKGPQEDLASGMGNYWTTYLATQINFVAHATTYLGDRLPEGGRYLWKNIYPQAEEGNLPVYSKAGRYVVRLFVRSQWRAVVIDDRVPVDADGNCVFPVSTSWLRTGEFWPVLLAKAICAVDPSNYTSGGKMFLHYLSGWISQEYPLAARGEDAKAASPWGDIVGVPNSLGALLWEEPPFAVSAPPQSPVSKKKRRVHIPHPRCYLVRPDMKSADDDEDEAGAAPVEGLSYCNLSVKMLKKKYPKTSGLQLGGKPEPEKVAALKMRTTSAASGAWSRFPTYTVVFARDNVDQLKQIDDTWAELKQPFSNQPRYMLYQNGSVKTRAHLMFEPVVPEVDAAGQAGEAKADGNDNEAQAKEDSKCSSEDKDEAQQGEAKQGEAKQGEATQGEAKQGEATQGEAKQGEATQGEAKQGEAKQGEAKQGEAKQGEAKQEEAKREGKEVSQVDSKKSESKEESEAKLDADGPRNDDAPVRGEVPAESGPSYRVTLFEFDWLSNTRKVVTQRKFYGCQFLSLVLEPGKRYAIQVENECGCMVTCSSKSRFELREWKSGMGNVWRESKDEGRVFKVQSQTESGSYAQMTGGEWVTLFHALMRVPAAVTPIAFEVGEDGAENEDEGKPVGAIDGEAFRVSACLQMMDRDILPYVVLQWVNQDTLEVERSFLLDAAPKALKPNEKGYSLTASVLAPRDMCAGSWTLSMLSNSAPEEFTLSQMKVSTVFRGQYAPNYQFVVFRESIGSEAATPATVTVSLSDRSLGAYIGLYDQSAVEVKDGLAVDPAPAFETSRFGQAFLPSLAIGGGSSYLLQCRLDSLTLPGGPLSQYEGKLEWTISFSSDSEVQLQTDNTQGAFFKAVKDSWEAAEAGRAEKAEASRKKHLDEKKAVPPPRRIAPQEGKGAILMDESMRKRVSEERSTASAVASNHIKAMGIWKTAEIDQQLEESKARLQDAKSWVEESSKQRTEREESFAKLREDGVGMQTALSGLQKALAEGNEAIEAALAALDKAELPEWRAEQFRNAAVARIEANNAARYKELLSVAYADRDYDAIFAHVKALRVEGASFLMRRWNEYALQSTLSRALAQIKVAMGDPSADEPEVDVKAIQAELEIVDKLKKCVPLEQLDVTQESTDLLASAAKAVEDVAKGKK